VGQRGPLRARERRPAAWEFSRAERKRERKGLAGLRRKERGEGVKGFFLFLFSFQIRFSNFQTSIKQKPMHSNHDAQTLIISKFFSDI
jgi:hypothetical protein